MDRGGSSAAPPASRLMFATRRGDADAKDVVLVEKDALGRWFRVHGAGALKFTLEGFDKCQLVPKAFHAAYELLDAEAMKLFSDDSYQPQLIYPSEVNKIEVFISGPSSRAGGEVQKLQLVRRDGAYHSRISIGKNKKSSTTHVLSLYSTPDTCPTLTSMPADGTCSIDVGDTSAQTVRNVNSTFYRFQDSWSLPCAEGDTLPRRAEIMSILQRGFAVAGNMGALLATISVAAFFVVALAFASMDEPSKYEEFASRPVFIAFMIFIAASLFSALSAMLFVAQNPVNASGMMHAAMRAGNPETARHEVLDSCLQYVPGSYDGLSAEVRVVTQNWYTCLLRGTFTGAYWAGQFLLISILTLSLATLLGGFLILFQSVTAAVLFFATFGAVFCLCWYGLISTWKQLHNAGDLGFWEALWLGTGASLVSMWRSMNGTSATDGKHD